MASIYIHIPFCKKACHYCNFHFSTSIKYKSELVASLVREIEIRKNYLDSATIKTIYLGGGTPSLLSADELNFIFDHLHKYHTISEDTEITLEANPDDLTKDYLSELRQSPVNRLSIGIQSFSDEDLTFMNRSHNATQALDCVKLAKANNFTNISVDLIYGAPTTSTEQWSRNLQKIFELQIPHLSCYALTVEPNTALAHFIKTGKSPNVDDDKQEAQFLTLLKFATQAGYEQYEISNFCIGEKYSVHNSNYWQGKPYLGIGPSAHSFNGEEREWNISHNQKYLSAIGEGKIDSEKEILSETDRYNEYVMTSLRTKWGCKTKILHQFNSKYIQYFKSVLPSLTKKNLVISKDDGFYISDKGKFVADMITRTLFFTE